MSAARTISVAVGMLVATPATALAHPDATSHAGAISYLISAAVIIVLAACAWAAPAAWRKWRRRS